MSATTTAVTSIELTALPKIAKGKVRELFAVDDKTLLFVATDRMSAYDVVLDTGVPDKSIILNLSTVWWFKKLQEKIPGLRTHFVSLEPPAQLPAAEAALIRHRSMQVRRLRVFPIEAIVRGYLAGSAWTEYSKKGTVHGLAVPAGLRQCDKLPAPMYTPSTKAEQGQHDENITPAQAAEIVGPKYAGRIEELALAVYSAAADYASERGILIADTKFEFGLDEATDEVVLIDEVLTPDSSRFWPADKYEPGRDQDSFDKQFIRNWLTSSGLKGKQGVAIPDDIARATSDRYRAVFSKLTGQTLGEALAGPFP
ncbi:phosphoribosylaminoimidazole-succinocarboxamide synthase [Magnaporthiopsis poae ATCC 64411]|uniref:Phosphoribosylaminoimidazole-succinocarboxamide synthase n=1 Tax=Magnaporthiopsis poae (strain ATCC 64411 / 73-15) TaxID=644358 RepID=A0A0C4DRM4_MAGP6|nr:phosphoribosylaminoimidazole-succinocarboxamide synthase [Magnaporthiopsis poae ATCC 64411]